MTKLTPSQSAANTMTAVAHLFVGEPGRSDQLNEHVAIVVGAPVDCHGLLRWAEQVGHSGRQIIHISFPDPTLPVPRVAVVFVIDGQTHIFESCSLWQPENGGGAYLVPADPYFGAFHIGDDMMMHQRPGRPFANKKAENAGYVRAYTRLLDIMKQQIEDCIPLDDVEHLDLRVH